MNFTVQRSVKVNKRSIRHPSILFHLSIHPSGNPLEIYPIPSPAEWEEEAIAISLFQHPLCRIYFSLLFPFHPIRKDINGSSRIGSPDQILWFFFRTPYIPQDRNIVLSVCCDFWGWESWWMIWDCRIDRRRKYVSMLM